MPATEDFSRIIDLSVTKEWLLQQLRSDSKHLVLLDCRSTNEFSESHIRHSVNLSIPSIMLRRLSAGKISLLSTIKNRELKERIVESYNRDVFVLYGDDDIHTREKNSASEVLYTLLKRLRLDGCNVVCLEEGYSAFRAAYPEWCESSKESEETLPDGDPITTPLLGLRSLRITTASPTSSYLERTRLAGSSCGSSTDSSDSDDRCDSSLGLEDDKDFPVEILPYLYLGNAANSEDIESLSRHGIEYILNVTADLANVFEDHGNIKYMQIPIADHWSQNLARFFPRAIKFIDEGRNKSKGVLVHCLAGISRSVTVTVAYLMYKLNLTLNDAFNMVRDRKANIAPNFHFMEQLHNFEQELKVQPSLQEWKEEDDPFQQTADLPFKRHTCPKCAPTNTPCTCRRQQRRLARLAVSGDESTIASAPQPQQFLSPVSIETHCPCPPDSGIEFDRWTPSSSSGE